MLSLMAGFRGMRQTGGLSDLGSRLGQGTSRISFSRGSSAARRKRGFHCPMHRNLSELVIHSSDNLTIKGSRQPDSPRVAVPRVVWRDVFRYCVEHI